MKDISLGINSQIAYPKGHPMIKSQIEEILKDIELISKEEPEISFVFFSNNIVVGDFNIDSSDFAALENFVKRFKKMDVQSVTIDVDCMYDDIAGFIEVAANPLKDISVYDDINDILIEKNSNKVYFNTVELQIRSRGEEDEEEGFGFGLGLGDFGLGEISEGEGEGMGDGAGVGSGGEESGSGTGAGSGEGEGSGAGTGVGTAKGSGEGTGEGIGEGSGSGEGLGEGGEGDGEGTSKFDVNAFLQKGCGIKGDEGSREESDKVTKGLLKLYDEIVKNRGEEDIASYSSVFNDIISSVSKEARKDILTNKIKKKKISSIIKSIIMTFSDEEIIEIFLAKTKLLGVHDAKEIFDNLTPSRLDELVPKIREKINSVDIEEKYIEELEEALWSKGGGSGIGGPGDGGRVSNFVEDFASASFEDYGKKEVSSFFRSVCDLKGGEGQKVDKIVNGYSSFVNEFVKQFGMDEFLKQSGKIRKTFQAAPEPVRRRIFQHILKKGGHLELTMLKAILPIVDDDVIIEGILYLLEQDKEPILKGFLYGLQEERLEELRGKLEEELKSNGWEDDDIEDLWYKLNAKVRFSGVGGMGGGEGEGSSKGGRGFGRGGVSKRAYKRIYRRLQTGMDLAEINSLIESLYGNLEAGSKEVKINTISNIRSLNEEFLESGKIAIVRRIMNKLMKFANEENDMDVYSEYADLLAESGLQLKEEGYEFIVRDLISFFARQTDNLEKAKRIVPYLPGFNSEEATNVLLSLLWEEEMRDVVVEKVRELGAESVPSLMTLLEETEDDKVRFALLDMIKSVGEDAKSIIKEYLGHDKWYVRRNAVLLLGGIGEEEDIEDIYALKDDNEKIQIEVIRAIKHIMGSDSEKLIAEFIGNDSPQVEKAAIAALENILTGKGVGILNRRLLKTKHSTEDELEIKNEISDILSREGNESSKKYLAEIVKSKKMFGIPEYPEELRYKALHAILKIGGSGIDRIVDEFKTDRSKKIRDLVEQYS